MRKIGNIYIGGKWDCGVNLPTVHACKSCHSKVVGRVRKGDAEYLVAYRGRDIFLNLVDMDVLLPEYTAPIMVAFLGFMSDGMLIHCDQGISRSPSLGMLYLAYKGVLPASYKDARREFDILYPWYAPNKGIDTYLRGVFDGNTVQVPRVTADDIK